VAETVPPPPPAVPEARGLGALANALWATRVLVLLGVLGSVAAALAVFYLASADTFYMIAHLRSYADPALDSAAREALHDDTVFHVVEIVDGYLLATGLLIFAMGLFELYIAPLDRARASHGGASLPAVRNLTDLKSRLGNVVLIIMIVTFFGEVVRVNARSPLELLWVAGGIALVGVTLWLTHTSGRRH
jgi:uncharacterized membrane protein YqhA